MHNWRAVVVRIIDLTLPLDETFSDFHPPNHPDFNLEVFARLKTHFRHNCKFSMSVHTGSHVEGPNHAVDFEIDRLTDKSPTHDDFVAHQVLLGGGVPIIEFIRNLHLLPETGFQIIALPLPMAGADGNPVPAVGVVS